MINQPTISARHNAKPPTTAQDKATRFWQKFIGINPDGGFGPITTAATKRYQSAHGLKPDGEVGPKTWATVPEPIATGAATAPVQQVTPKQQTIAATNAAATASSNIAKQAVKPPVQVAPKPPVASAPVAAVKQAATATTAAVKKHTAAATQAATKQVQAATAAVKQQPLWLRILAGVAAGLGGIAVFKAATDPKRKSA